MNISPNIIFSFQIAMKMFMVGIGSRESNLLTTWSSIVGEKNVSLQREREVWKAFAAKLRVTCQVVDKCISEDKHKKSHILQKT